MRQIGISASVQQMNGHCSDQMLVDTFLPVPVARLVIGQLVFRQPLVSALKRANEAAVFFCQRIDKGMHVFVQQNRGRKAEGIGGKARIRFFRRRESEGRSSLSSAQRSRSNRRVAASRIPLPASK